VAHAILTKSKDGTAYPTAINLAGVGLGNGLTDPVTQYQYYPEMAMNNTYGIKTVSETTYAAMVAKVPDCVSLATACNAGGSDQQCKAAQIACGQWETSPYYATGLNPYDIRIPCEVPGLCYNFTMVDEWLTDPNVLAALHVRTDKSSPWESCNYDVNGDFGPDWMKGYQVMSRVNVVHMVHVVRVLVTG
jgi:cathepsin A (carboxypeptidase C)